MQEGPKLAQLIYSGVYLGALRYPCRPGSGLWSSGSQCSRWPANFRSEVSRSQSRRGSCGHCPEAESGRGCCRTWGPDPISSARVGLCREVQAWREVQEAKAQGALPPELLHALRRSRFLNIRASTMVPSDLCSNNEMSFRKTWSPDELGRRNMLCVDGFLPLPASLRVLGQDVASGILQFRW